MIFIFFGGGKKTHFDLVMFVIVLSLGCNDKHYWFMVS